MKTCCLRTLLFGGILVVLIGAFPVWADNYDLTLPTGTVTWSSASWDPVGIPGALDTVNITGSGTGQSYLQLDTATISVDTFNFKYGVNTFITAQTTGDRTFNVGTLNFEPSTNGTLRFLDSSAKDPGLLAINIGTLNLNADVQGRVLAVGYLGATGGTIIKSFTVGNTNLNQGTLSIGAVRNDVDDPLNVNLGAVTITGSSSLLNLSYTASSFSNVILMESLAGTGGQILLGGGDDVEGTIQIVGSAHTSYSGKVGNGASHKLGDVNFTMSGTGTQTLAADNTYLGRTVVTSGALLVTGNHTQSLDGLGGGNAADGLYRVATEGALGGTGRIAGKASTDNSNMILVESGGNLAPGISNSIGHFTLDGVNMSGTGSRVLNMASGAEFTFDLAADGSDADRISFWNYAGADDLLLNNNKINLKLQGLVSEGDYEVVLFDFFNNNGTTATASGISSGLTLTGAYIDGRIVNPELVYNANDISLRYTVVPEPNTLALVSIVLGASFLLLFRRSQKVYA